MVDQQRRLTNTIGMGKSEGSFSLSLHCEVDVQWSAIVRRGSIAQADLDNSVALRGAAFANAGIGVFLHEVVVRRADATVSSWRNWPLVRPCRWLRSGMVLPSPFLRCDPALTTDGSGILSDPALIDEQFRKAWLPYFSRSVRGLASFSDFQGELAANF